MREEFHYIKLNGYIYGIIKFIKKRKYIHNELIGNVPE